MRINLNSKIKITYLSNVLPGSYYKILEYHDGFSCTCFEKLISIAGKYYRTKIIKGCNPHKNLGGIINTVSTPATHLIKVLVL